MARFWKHILLWLWFIFQYTPEKGFSGGASGKESACQCRRCKRHEFDPRSGRSPGERNGYPLKYSCLENSSDRRALWAIVHGVAKSWTWLSTSAHQPIKPRRNLPRSLLIWKKPSPAPSLQRTCPGINPPPLRAQTYSSYCSQWKSQCPVLTWLRTPTLTPLLAAPAPLPGQDAKRQEKHTSGPNSCAWPFPFPFHVLPVEATLRMLLDSGAPTSALSSPLLVKTLLLTAYHTCFWLLGFRLHPHFSLEGHWHTERGTEKAGKLRHNLKDTEAQFWSVNFRISKLWGKSWGLQNPEGRVEGWKRSTKKR